jgi:hypothetical protein
VTGSLYVAQIDLSLKFLLPLLPKYWDCKLAQFRLAAMPVLIFLLHLISSLKLCGCHSTHHFQLSIFLLLRGLSHDSPISVNGTIFH